MEGGGYEVLPAQQELTNLLGSSFGMWAGLLLKMIPAAPGQVDARSGKLAFTGSSQEMAACCLGIHQGQVWEVKAVRGQENDFPGQVVPFASAQGHLNSLYQPD